MTGTAPSGKPMPAWRTCARRDSAAVPTVTVDGQYDPFTPAGDGAVCRAHFTGKYAHRTLPVGHNVPQEDPQGFSQAVIAADHL